MYEVELKVRADHDVVRELLRERDAERTGRVRQRDTYYDAPHRDFAETDEALRLRRETPLDGGNAEEERTGDGKGTDHGANGPAVGDVTTKVTYKGPLIEAESKTREEHETAVAEGEEMAGVLDGLGFEPAADVEKERECYRLDGYAVVLDRVTDLGEFVEVEREANEGDVEAVREGATDLLRSLDLDPEAGIRTSYLGLLLSQNSPEDTRG